MVDAKGEPNCSPAAAASATGGTTGDVAGGLIDPLELVGLPSSAADARLAKAGSKVYASNTTVDPNGSRGNVTDIWWSSERRCLAGHVANDRYEVLQSMPQDKCKREAGVVEAGRPDPQRLAANSLVERLAAAKSAAEPMQMSSSALPM